METDIQYALMQAAYEAWDTNGVTRWLHLICSMMRLLYRH